MRIYKYRDTHKPILTELICNHCGKKIPVSPEGIPLEDVLTITKEWGYFSKKDCEIHHIDICEECYDKIIKNFKIPPQITEKNEVMS